MHVSSNVVAFNLSPLSYNTLLCFDMIIGARERMVVYIEVRQDICMVWPKPYVSVAQPHLLYSLPEGGLTSTLPLPTSSQLVLSAVPPLSV